jgi:hypothetical protein
MISKIYSKRMAGLEEMRLVPNGRVDQVLLETIWAVFGGGGGLRAELLKI